MIFNFEKTTIYKSLRREKFPLFGFANFFKNLFLSLLILSLFLFGISFLGIYSFDSALRVFSILLVLYVFFAEMNLFLEEKIKNPDMDIDFAKAAENAQDYNLAELLNFESAGIVNDAIGFCKKKKISEISAQALLFSILDKSKQAKYIFLRLGMDAANIQHDLKNSLENKEKNTGFKENFADDFNTAMLEAVKSAVGHKHERIEPIDILDGISRAEFFKKILIQYDLKEEDFENMSLWFDYLEDRIKLRKRFWDAENLASMGSLGKDWASGYTVTLDQYSIDWRSLTRKWLYKAIIGHEKQIEETQMILSRPDINNVLIVGEPGVGRESVIEGIARRIYLGKSLPELNYYRVVELDMASILARTKGPDELEMVLNKIFSEVMTAGNIILVIKELHNYVGVEQGQAGTADISGIIESYLKLPQFKFIGTTNYNGLHTRIEKNTAFAALFAKVEVGEISEMETIMILQNNALELEQKYKVFVTYPAIRELVNLSARYIPNVPFPKKAIDLLQDVVIYVARSSNEKVVLPDHVDKVISTKTEIPVGKINFKEKEVLLNMEKLLHDRIIGQEEAVKEISVAMRRARAGIASKTRPMGTFLFLGPTGVGKTETAKALAEIYFGGEKKMIRLDMSEFQAVSDIPRLIGSTGQEGLLTTPVRDTPFSLLLLDEIEKAHPNILNLFLQVLDEGNLTDGQGRKIIFTNVIIICTSNAGADFIFQSVEKTGQVNRDELLNQLFTKGLFRPEFVNRFDATVIFRPLTREDLMNIAQLSLNSLKKSLKNKDIDFTITNPLKEKIVELSYKPAFGAREMRRVIQDKVENVVAQALLSDEVKKGQSFEILPDDFKLIVQDNN